MYTSSQYICEVDVVSVDFQKEFDEIKHYVLLSKFNYLEMSSNLQRLLESYLIAKEQYVYYKGYKCATLYPSSGVPQWCKLGPLLIL